MSCELKMKKPGHYRVMVQLERFPDFFPLSFGVECNIKVLYIIFILLYIFIHQFYTTLII